MTTQDNPDRQTGLVKADTGQSLSPTLAIQRAKDIAGVCKEIVLRTAQMIRGKRYVRVEGWESIAAAHGCVPGILSVTETEDGVSAIAALRRIDNGQIIATAEGFVGNDEPLWYGGQDDRGEMHAGRYRYARRAMAQTRAISRVCRAAFAHVVVLMDAGLETTPAEEIPVVPLEEQPAPEGPAPTLEDRQPERPKPERPKPERLPDGHPLLLLDNDEAIELEAVFEEIQPPPPGKKANRVVLTVLGAPVRCWTMHKMERVTRGQKVHGLIRAVDFNKKRSYELVKYQVSDNPESQGQGGQDA